MPEAPTLQELTVWGIIYLVFLFSTTLHEAAHAWVAKLGGDLTAYHGSQVSLSPLPHIQREPFGMVILPLLSLLLSGWAFGYASAPYSRYWAANYPRRAALMALAGPAANLALVVIVGLILRSHLIPVDLLNQAVAVRFQTVAIAAEGPWESVAMLLSIFFYMNVLLAVFNLIPLPPLDGSTAIGLFLSDRANARYQELIWGNPWLQLIGILLAWRLFYYLFDPVFRFAVAVLHVGTV